MTEDKFENPANNPAEGGASSSSEFENPPSAGSTMADAEAAQVNAFLSDVDSSLLEAKAAIERNLMSRGSDAPIQTASSAGSDNIIGVGIGGGEGPQGAGAPGSPVLVVYVIEPMTQDSLTSTLASALGVSAASSGDLAVQQVVTGVIDIQPHRMRLRPAPCGISVGHKSITAGTTGCLVRGRSAPRINRLMILSNNHVLANSNSASIGDCITQPGPFDGGKCPADQIAVLERFIPIRFDNVCNFVDCATGWAWPDRVRREEMFLSGGAVQLFRIGAVPVAAVPGMQVGKSGRTTQLTRGSVTAVGVTIRVNYGGGRVALFCDQIAIRAASGDFSQGGDSGSLIWTWDNRRAPVGLLFAGGGGTTFANRIGRVLDALDVNVFA